MESSYDCVQAGSSKRKRAVMGPILFLLPLATFSVLFLHLLGRASDDPADAKVPWRKAFLLAAIFWGSFVALSSEILGLFGLIDRSLLMVA